MTDASPIPPVVKTIRVARTPDDAFRLFTAELGLWWPLATHSLGGALSTVALQPHTGGEIIETAPDGARHVWGTVIAFEPGRHLAFTWHVGRTPDHGGLVEVHFTPDGPATIVDLVHSGWERIGGPGVRQMRDNYNAGWVEVFERCYGGHAGLAPSP